MISKLLIYPDALSLKHSSNYLYNLVDTGVSVKVEWLILRHNLHLKGPDDKKCDLRSDLQFCRGSIPVFPSPEASRTRVPVVAWRRTAAHYRYIGAVYELAITARRLWSRPAGADVGSGVDGTVFGYVYGHTAS
ncbi:F-box domain-containing protein [Ceratocystis lukuohia]|uniref:F-box domain-containing protein n=1 Tax=Ceratocystis lukuohia TaxID=2019550 RepID=A0ABR4MFR7_9PEZI